MSGTEPEAAPPAAGPAPATGHSALTSAADRSQHELEPDAIGLVQSTVLSVASSAPTASMTISIGVLLVAAAYGGAITILIVVLPMLAIAYSYSRLNRWDPNCGASYVWVGRSMGPYLGFMIGWVVLAATIYGDIASALPVGPAFLSIVGLNPSSQIGTGLAATALCGAVAFLGWIIVKSLQTFSSGAITALAITIGLGVVAMLAARLVNKSPFFALPRERYVPRPAVEVS